MATLYTTGIALFARSKMQVNAIKRALKRAEKVQKSIDRELKKGQVPKDYRKQIGKNMIAIEEAIRHLANLMHDANLLAYDKIQGDLDYADDQVHRSGLSKEESWPIRSSILNQRNGLRDILDINIVETQRMVTEVKRKAPR